ncbi:hypothetical protein [Streptomyces virginiae]|uniref:hypothetical protein n=1 Tax=Streptomyces virginiae TaxID=1961 RepID=UPI002DD82B49|nr:hypothetical protein [Streptomyces virginiae]
MAGFEDGVVVGHIGGPHTAEETIPSGDGAPADEQNEQHLPDPGTPPAEPTSAPPPADDSGSAEDDPAPDSDPYGTGDLFDEFGLTPPQKVPAPPPQDDLAPDPDRQPAGVPDGQMALEAVVFAADQGGSGGRRERLTSADGRLVFTLARVPEDGSALPDIVEGYQRQRDEFTAHVQAQNDQTGLTAEERAERLAGWRRTYKGANGLEAWRPLPSLRLTRKPDAPGLTPAEYAVGSWVTWQDTATGTQVTGQVMAPGVGTGTWYVSTDRTGVTGEYHVLARAGKKSTGYTYSISGDAAGLRPADGPPEALPFDTLPAVDAVPARPVASYADYVPKHGMAMVREPLPVRVGEDEIRGSEVVFTVTVDGLPFVVKVDQDDISLSALYKIRVEAGGRTVAELGTQETRADAVYTAVRRARELRDLAEKPLAGGYRDHTLDVAEDGVCAKCHRQFGGDDEVQPLYRVDGGDPTCTTHIAAAFDVGVPRVEELGLARRVMAVRTVPEPPATIESTGSAAVAEAEKPAVALPPDRAREIERNAVRPGDLVTAVVSPRSVERTVPWNEIHDTVSITGTVYPGHLDYHGSTILLDAVIHDPAGSELASGEDVLLRQLPERVSVTPAGHRDELRPESRTVAQIRLGDLIAEGGTRGEVVTEIRHGFPGLSFSTRDVTKGTPNGFSLSDTARVSVVPRERRRPEDMAEVFGRHHSHFQAIDQTRLTHQLHTALDGEAARLWPDGDGPNAQLRALSEAIGEIDADASGMDVYRANAEAMTTAATAAADVFDAVDDAARRRGLGEPLHRLRQHLDVQIYRLHADIAHLDQRAQARAAADEQAPTFTPTTTGPPATAKSEPPAEASEPAPKPTLSNRESGMPTTDPSAEDPVRTQEEQVGLFGSTEATADRTAPEEKAPTTPDMQAPASGKRLAALDVTAPNLDEVPNFFFLREGDDGSQDRNGLYADVAGRLHGPPRRAKAGAEQLAPERAPDAGQTQPAPAESLTEPAPVDADTSGQLDLFGPEPDLERPAPQTPIHVPEDSEMATPAPPQTPEAGEPAAAAVPAAPAPAEQNLVPAVDEQPEEVTVEDPPLPRPYTEMAPLSADAGYELHLSGVDGQRPDHGELRLASGAARIAMLRRDAAGQWSARLDLEGLPYDETGPVNTPQEAADNAALMYSVYAGVAYGRPPMAVPGADARVASDVLREELETLAALHGSRLADVAVRLPVAQRGLFRELDERLTNLGGAVVEAHGSRHMAVNLDEVREAAMACLGAVPDADRRFLAYPLAHLMFDVRSSRLRLDATLAAVRDAQIAQAALGADGVAVTPAPQETRGATEVRPAAGPVPPQEVAAPAAEPPTGRVPAARAPQEARPASGAQPVADPALPQEAPVVAQTTAAPAEPAQAAPTAAPPAAPPMVEPHPPVPASAVAERSAPRPAVPASGGGAEEAAEKPAQAPVSVGRPDAALAAAVPPPAELPLWVASDGAADTQGTDASTARDLLTAFQKVQQAWADVVPSDRGTAAELVADVREDLLTLQNLIGEAVGAGPQAPMQASRERAAAPAPPGSETAGDTPPERDRQQAATAVNVALRHADAHELSLRDLPEWQWIHTVRGAAGHLMTVLKDRAGDHFDRLMGDGRVRDFFRDLSARACDKIAGWAQAGAERLRRGAKGSENPADLPSAEALLRLGDAAFAYNTPRNGGTPPADGSEKRVNTPELRKLGEALARPMPGNRPKVSASAARSRSATAKRPVTKPAPDSAEQATHLRRGGPDQPQPRKPQR